MPSLFSDSEMNPYKIFYIIDIVIVLASWGVVWTDPVHTGMAQYYAWGTLGIILLLIADLIIANELFDTATIEVKNKKYPLLRLNIHPLYIIFGTIALGIIIGIFYYNLVLTQSKLFIIVPDIYSTSPTSITVSPQLMEEFMTSYPVAGVEDTFWFGMLLPTVIGLIWLGSMKLLGEGIDLIGLAFAMFVGVILVAYSFAYIGHNSAVATRGATTVAFQDTFNYGIYCGSTVALSGNTLACRFAHTLHNWASVELKYRQPFQVYNPAPYTLS